MMLLQGRLFWSVFYSWTLSTKSLTPKESSQLVDTVLLPLQDYGKRARMSREIFQGNGAIAANDPATAFTYGEFPFDSLDTLLDKALEYCDATDDNTNNDPRRRIRFLDLGSGCARLCLYLALSRGGTTTRTPWEIHGIEAMERLHKEAKRAEQVAVDHGWLSVADGADKNNPQSQSSSTTSLHLHHGLAEEFPSILQTSDIIFMYSTAMQSGPFLPAVQGVLLSSNWHELLSRHVRPNCIVITTDRALDPSYGWTLHARLDVANPEVFGSTGFIQQYTGTKNGATS